MPHGLAGEGLGWDPRAAVSNISTPHLCSSPQHSAHLLQLIYTTEAGAQTHKYRFQQIMISFSTILPLALSTTFSAIWAKKHLKMNSDTLIGPHLFMSGLQILSLFSFFFFFFVLFLLFFITFYWSIVSLQCCVRLSLFLKSYWEWDPHSTTMWTKIMHMHFHFNCHQKCEHFFFPKNCRRCWRNKDEWVVRKDHGFRQMRGKLLPKQCLYTGKWEETREHMRITFCSLAVFSKRKATGAY